MIPSFVLNLQDFSIVNLICEDESWSTYLIENRENNINFISKSQNDKYETQDSQIKIINLIDMLSKLSNPLFVKYLGFNLYNLNHQPRLTIISNYGQNGLLTTLLGKMNDALAPLDWNDTKKYIILLGIAFGIHYLNSIGYSFEKLSPDHIFLNNFYYPQLCNYNFLKNTEENDRNLKEDVFYFSLISYKLITNNSENIIYSQIPGKKNRLFFKECLSENPDERPNMTEIIQYMLDKPFKKLFEQIKSDELLNFLDFYGYENPDVLFIKSLISLENSDSEILKSDAIKLLIESANKGSTNAMYKYSHILREEENNISKYIEYLEQAKNGGNSKAMFELASLFERGDEGIKIDKEKAIQYYKMAIEKGNSDAMYRVFCMIFDHEINDSEEKAVEYLKMAVSKRNPEALNKIGFLVLNDIQEIEGVDKQKALDFLKIAVDKGNVNALFNLGCYLDSNAENEDDKLKGVRYIKKAADKGNTDAMLAYGKKFENGKDKEIAVRYFKLAADNGNREAMFKYGCLIENTNEEEAKRYFKMATEKDKKENKYSCCIQ